MGEKYLQFSMNSNFYILKVSVLNSGFQMNSSPNSIFLPLSISSSSTTIIFYILSRLQKLSIILKLHRLTALDKHWGEHSAACTCPSSPASHCSAEYFWCSPWSSLVWWVFPAALCLWVNVCYRNSELLAMNRKTTAGHHFHIKTS